MNGVQLSDHGMEKYVSSEPALEDFRNRILRAFCTDCDGTIWNTEMRLVNLQQLVAERRGVVCAPEFPWPNLAGMSILKRFEMLLDSSLDNPNGATPTELHDAFEDQYELVPGTNPKIFDNAVPVLERAYEEFAGKVAPVTGATKRIYRHTAKFLHVNFTFPFAITKDEVTWPKPDKESYVLAANGLGIPAENCIALEDTENGARAALAAGCVVAGIYHANVPDHDYMAKRDSLRNAGVDFLLPDWKALAELFGWRMTFT